MHGCLLSIETPRLRLIALLADALRALIADDTRLASQLLGVEFPARWPGEQAIKAGLPWHLAHLEADARRRAWHVRAIVERSSARVIGSIHLNGLPDKRGDVEIGWGIEPEYRLHGYAAEAAAALASWIVAQPAVATLSATIPDDNVASQRVALHLGMTRTPDTRRELPLWQSRVPPTL